MHTDTEERVFTSILRYASSSLYRRALAAITAVLRPLLLSPEMFGLWTVLKVFPTYASYLHFGSRSAMRFRIPRFEAAGDTGAIAAYKASVYYGSALPVVALSSVLLLVAAVSVSSVEARVGLVGISIVLLLTWRYDFFISVLKAHQKFKVISAANYYKATVYLISTAILVWLFGFYGVVLTAIVTVMVMSWYVRSTGRINVPLPGDASWQVYLELVREGFPIMAFDFFVLLIRTSDRFVLMYFFDAATVGLYGLAIMFVGLALSIPAVAREVVEPRLMQSLDYDAMADIVRVYMTGPLLHTAALMPLAVGWGVLLLPPLVQLVLPAYAGALQALVILLLGSYFTAGVYALRGVIVAAGLQLVASLMLGLALLFSVGLSISLLVAGAGIEAVAFATGLTFALLLIGLLAYVHGRLELAGGGFGFHLAILLVPFMLMCLLLFFPATDGAGLLPGSTGELLLRTCVFTLLQGGLLLLMWRQGWIFRKDAGE